MSASFSAPMSPADSLFSAKQLRASRLRDIERRAVAKVEDEYKDEIAAQMQKLEMATLPDVAMIDLQPELEWHMRPYLLDFLVESHLSLYLQPQTLFLAVNLFDRYCSRRVVFKKHYQLVGCAALWIASKYEDKKDRVPTVRELKIMCCDAYEEDMFVQMEGHVLSTLDWSIGHPTADSFLKQYLRHNCSPTLEHLALYLCEMTMFHKSFLGFPPSVIASAAHAVAQHVLMSANASTVVYSSPLSFVSSPQESQCVTLLSQFMMHVPSLSLQKKYSSASFSQVALILLDFVARQQQQQQQQQQQTTSVTEMPPTPPPTSESLVPKFERADATMDDTPSSFAGCNNRPYMTPPCTPDEVVCKDMQFMTSTTCAV